MYIINITYEIFPTFVSFNVLKYKMKVTEPTKSELEILKVLWQQGPSTVRTVNDELNKTEEKSVQYSTTLKLMQIMTDKGLVTRDESNMKHIYAPAISENITKNHLLTNFVETLFDGSKTNLLMQLLGDKKVSQRELQEIQKLINEISK
jgi:BlaI family transcriptional regulator, penicillinase repressor